MASTFDLKSATPPAARLEPPGVPPGPILPVDAVVLYGDAAAGRFALRVLRRLGAHLLAEIEFKPVLWRFDLMADPRWRAIAVDDARTAGLIVIATSDANQLPADINAWLGDCLARRRDDPLAIVTLYGDHEAWAIWLQDRFQICTKRQCLAAQVHLPGAPAGGHAYL